MPREFFNYKGREVPTGMTYVSKVYGGHPDGKGRRIWARVGPGGIIVDGKAFTSLAAVATAACRLIATGKHDGTTVNDDGSVNQRLQGGDVFFVPADTPENASLRANWHKGLVDATEGMTAPAELADGQIVILEDDSVTPRGKAATLPATKADNDAALAAENIRHERRIAALTANGDRLSAEAVPAVPVEADTVEADSAETVETGGKGKGKGRKGKGK